MTKMYLIDEQLLAVLKGYFESNNCPITAESLASLEEATDVQEKAKLFDYLAENAVLQTDSMDVWYDFFLPALYTDNPPALQEYLQFIMDGTDPSITVH